MPPKFLCAEVHQNEVLGKTQVALEEVYVPAAFGESQDSSRR